MSMVRCMLFVMVVMVVSMIIVSIIVMHSMIRVTIEMIWMVEIIGLDIMVFNTKMICSFNDMPQLIVIMLKISHQILSTVFFYVVRVIMVGPLDDYIMVP